MPLGLLALLLARRYLPADRPAAAQGAQRFDKVGTLLLAATLAAYALATTLGRGRFGPLNLGLLAAAGLGAGLFVLAEAKAASPLIRLAAFRDPVLSAGLLTSGLVMTVMMTTLVVGPFHLAHALGLNAALAGLAMSAGPAVSALTGAPAGRLVDRFGPVRMIGLGLAGMATGSILLAAMPLGAGVPGYVAPLVVLTAGYALFQAANNTAVMKEVRPDQRGGVSGLLNLSRNLGLFTGASAMGAVFALATAAADVGTAGPAAVAAATRTTFAVAALLVLAALAIAAVSRRRAARGSSAS
nr:MFS transporter [Chitinimonas koreensis]